jgi:predicted PurR-regulated permease PerM/methylmalonyl-CoA mutase cobalamin-binding subunit
MTKQRGSSPLFILVAVVTTIAALYFAKAILLPIFLAILLSFLLAPLADRLEYWRVPRIPAVLIVVGMSFAVLGGIGWAVSQQSYALIKEIPRHKEIIKSKIETIRPDSPAFTRFVQALYEIRDSVAGTGAPKSLNEQSTPTGETDSKAPGNDPDKSSSQADASIAGRNVGSAAAPGKDVQVQLIESPGSLLAQVQSVVGSLLSPLATGGIIIVLVLFLLLDRENQRTRIVQLFGRSHLHAASEAMHDVTKRVGRYLRLLFLVNSSYGLAIAIGLWFIGVPGAIMWGVLGFSLRFVPYLGPWIAASIPILVSVATSTGWTQPILVIGMFVVVELISNNLIEPLVYGNTMGISTVGVVIAAIFWTWLWGPVGLILAMPMTVCLVVVARYVPQLRFITVLLADRPPLSAAEHVYQRLLAFDYQEPLKLARKTIKESSLVAYYDDVLVPALIMSEHDRHAELLNDDQAAFVLEAAEDLVSELGEAAVAARLEGTSTESDQPPSGEERTESAILATRILCVPLRDEGDEIASRMLAQLLIVEGFPVVTSGAELLTSEVVDRVAATDADVVVISILPPITHRDSRLLWKRLRRHYPNLPIIVGIWSGSEDTDTLPAPPFDEQVAGSTVTTLSQALALIRSTAAQLRLAAKAV